jgi:hypothetical protein
MSTVQPTAGPFVASAVDEPTGETTRWTERVDVFKCLGLSVVGIVLVLEWLAMRVHYGLRVVADTPTYIALMREMALHPLHPPSPFLATSHSVNVAHATPDLQLAALVWRGFAAVGVAPHNMVDAIGAYRLLAFKGALTTVLLAHATFVWMRSLAGRRVAWLGLAVLPAIWGPALVIFAGDLSFHGFMYASNHSETLAIALSLYALVALDRRFTGSNVVLGQVAVAAVMVTHPFTGVRLAALAAGLGAARAVRGDDWRLPPVALIGGFALASLWPMYDVSAAMWIAGLNGLAVVVVLALVPVAAASTKTMYARLSRIRLAALESGRAVSSFALLGALVVAGVAVREGREAWRGEAC